MTDDKHSDLQLSIKIQSDRSRFVSTDSGGEKKKRVAAKNACHQPFKLRVNILETKQFELKFQPHNVLMGERLETQLAEQFAENEHKILPCAGRGQK